MKMFYAAHFQISISSPDSHPSYTPTYSMGVISNHRISHCHLKLNMHSNGFIIYSLCGEFSKGYFCITSPWEKGNESYT